MKALSLLDEVVKNLEEHQNSLRIKKLIYAICKSKWENDVNRLNSIKLKELIQELQIANPTLDYLKYSLDKLVKTLNKPGEYTLVANVIVEQMTRLYPEPEEATQQVVIKNQTMQQSLEYKPNLGWEEPSISYDPFELRIEIMKYTNPLRAKILAYSVVYHLFDFSSQDWLSLKTKELDVLLHKLFDRCKTLKDLEYRLQTAAKSLNPTDEHTQAAGAIYQAMKRYYGNRELNHYQLENFVMNFDGKVKDDNDDRDDEGEETRQIRPS
ncbi:hypothetical protein ACE1B6_08915 [Aerosakkonemataceae cyanobacterium BLCC-F154]|uniref:Uncharacterized protein n=1 Tax=Floridaenema fluviatile BLCC-F154 TaxID=3153640 RepID=A0ABV4Y9N1_9CYAN